MPTAPDSDEALGGKGPQEPRAKRPGQVQAPGDILRGTDTRTPTSPASPDKAQRFAADQSFADAAHKPAASDPPSLEHEPMDLATSRGTLNLSEEEE